MLYSSAARLLLVAASTATACSPLAQAAPTQPRAGLAPDPPARPPRALPHYPHVAKLACTIVADASPTHRCSHFPPPLRRERERERETERGREREGEREGAVRERPMRVIIIGSHRTVRRRLFSSSHTTKCPEISSCRWTKLYFVGWVNEILRPTYEQIISSDRSMKYLIFMYRADEITFPSTQ